MTSSWKLTNFKFLKTINISDIHIYIVRVLSIRLKINKNLKNVLPSRRIFF